MKVRHRSNGYKDWKVLEESSTYYIAEGDFGPLALKKLEYEPVQEWVDVSIADVRKDTSGYNGLNGSCNSYFFVDKAGNILNDSHQPVVVDGRVILRRRKR